MILLWVFGGLLTALSVLLLVQPLLRRHPRHSHARRMTRQSSPTSWRRLIAIRPMA